MVLILNFTRPHAIIYMHRLSHLISPTLIIPYIWYIIAIVFEPGLIFHVCAYTSYCILELM